MTEADSENPYQSPHMAAGTTPPAAPSLTAMDVLRIYGNGVLASIAMVVFYLPFIAFGLGGAGANVGVLRFLFGLSVLAMLTLMFTWLVGLCQFVLALLALLKESHLWRHHLLSAVWVLICFVLWCYLASLGFFLTA